MAAKGKTGYYARIGRIGGLRTKAKYGGSHGARTPNKGKYVRASGAIPHPKKKRR